jgi:deoxycytidylate deaminase
MRKRQKKHNITCIIRDKRGRVLSVGKNSYTKTHPYQAACAAKTGNPDKIYLHAEIDALVSLSFQQKDNIASVHVIRRDARGNPVNAKPCDSCMLAFSQFGVTNDMIFHT